MKVDRPFPMLVRYELQDAPEGMLVAIHAVGTPGRCSAGPRLAMARQVRKSITGTLAGRAPPSKVSLVRGWGRRSAPGPPEAGTSG